MRIDYQQIVFGVTTLIKNIFYGFSSALWFVIGLRIFDFVMGDKISFDFWSFYPMAFKVYMPAIIISYSILSMMEYKSLKKESTGNKGIVKKIDKFVKTRAKKKDTLFEKRVKQILKVQKEEAQKTSNVSEDSK